MDQPRIITPGQQEMHPLEQITNVVRALQQSFAMINYKLNVIGQGLDMVRLTTSMALKIMVEHEMITEEELEKRYQLDVVTPIQKAFEEAKKHQTEQNEPNEEEVIEEEDNSNIILASERAKMEKSIDE